MPALATGYTAVAVLLHWAIALALVTNIALGWWMTQAIESPATQLWATSVYQVHKSIGLTVLLLSVLRLVWRLLHKPPPLPAGMPAWERISANTLHWAFYFLIIAIPISGWLYVSTQWRADAPLQVPTVWFGQFEVPNLFGLASMTNEFRQWFAGVTVGVHEYLAWTTVALLALHIAAALKHQFMDHDAVLARMIPALETGTETVPGERWRSAKLGLGFAGIAATAIVVATLLLPPNTTQAPADHVSGTAGITAAPGSWAINPSKSTIQFSGMNGGSRFDGHFTQWQVDVHIDPDNVTAAHIAATIQTASAKTGVAMYDEALRQPEWFDVTGYPVARFRTTSIQHKQGPEYLLSGLLTIKRHENQVRDLSLTVKRESAIISGHFQVDRLHTDLGLMSDPDGQWVPRKIDVQVRATLTRIP